MDFLHGFEIQKQEHLLNVFLRRRSTVLVPVEVDVAYESVATSASGYPSNTIKL